LLLRKKLRFVLRNSLVLVAKKFATPFCLLLHLALSSLFTSRQHSTWEDDFFFIFSSLPSALWVPHFSLPHFFPYDSCFWRREDLGGLATSFFYLFVRHSRQYPRLHTSRPPERPSVLRCASLFFVGPFGASPGGPGTLTIFHFFLIKGRFF